MQGESKFNVSPTTKLTNGLVGYWTFDGKDTNWTSGGAGTAKDISGYGNTGTLTNMSQATTTAIGKIGQGLNFDGVNDFVSTSMTTNLDNGMTITGWIKGNTTSNVTIFANGKTTDSGWWDFQFQTGNRLRFTKDGSTDLDARSTSAFSINSWQHFAITWTGGVVAATDIIFYKNGGIVAHDLNTNGISLVADSGTQKWIGARTNPTAFFNGILDNILIYNRVLTESEIKQLYNMGI